MLDEIREAREAGIVPTPRGFLNALVELDDVIEAAIAREAISQQTAALLRAATREELPSRIRTGAEWNPEEGWSFYEFVLNVQFFLEHDPDKLAEVLREDPEPAA